MARLTAFQPKVLESEGAKRRLASSDIIRDLEVLKDLPAEKQGHAAADDRDPHSEPLPGQAKPAPHGELGLVDPGGAKLEKVDLLHNDELERVLVGALVVALEPIIAGHRLGAGCVNNCQQGTPHRRKHGFILKGLALALVVGLRDVTDSHVAGVHLMHCVAQMGTLDCEVHLLRLAVHARLVPQGALRVLVPVTPSLAS